MLAALRERAPDVPVVMMSGRAGLSDAVRATKLGAFNFLEKPLTPEGVLLALASALELRQARREARALRADLGLAGEMIGKQPGASPRSRDDRDGRAVRRARADHRRIRERERSSSPRPSTPVARARTGRSFA